MDKWLSHPTALKIISLVMGILLWAVVHFDSERSPNTVASLTETRIIDAVKVEATGLDERNFSLRLMEPSSVMLKVRGSRSDLISASPDDYKVVVDVTGIEEGTRELPVTVSRLPTDVELVSVTPRTVKVLLEAMLTKEYEVNIKTEGTPANGYKIGAPIIKPNNRVHVTLPEDKMDEVGFVGAVVSVQDEEKTVTAKKVKVVVLDKVGDEMPEAVVNPSVVEVEVPITMPFKKVPLQIGFTGRLPDGLAVASFKPSVENVTIYGPQDVLNKYDFYDGINVDLSKLKQSGTMELNIDTVGGIETVDPPKMSVSVSVVPAETKVLPELPIKITGLSEGLKAKLTQPADGMMDLAVRGAANILAGVGSKDVQLIAKLSELGPGTHSVALDIQLPLFVESFASSPIYVTIVVTDGTEAMGPPISIPTDTPPAEPGNTGETNSGSGNSGSSGSSGSSGNNSGSGSGGDADPPGESTNGESGGTGNKEPGGTGMNSSDSGNAEPITPEDAGTGSGTEPDG
ncbi:CdaR family protein [Paenibacillus mendelii]|uniref:YbbR-like domain-containing protein n=1 Tax=Paenibacillus mendelii TaxID=206163 RepID=A0ABV6JA02_9BACL|nr:CdaR family protein [Paenibacillus mendelii]MCQ6560939.1 CdaR family protein [Paenibacillus mendelii]